MVKNINLLGFNKGLNNKIAPEYMPFHKTKGFEYVSECVNMDSDDSGRLHTRNGYLDTKITSECHSLFATETTALYVSGDALCLIDVDTNTTKPIRKVMPKARMSYLYAPPGRIYYCNGYQTGVVVDNVSQEWVMKDVVVKDGSNPSDPPVGHLVDNLGGYVFVACSENNQNVVYHSMPFSPNSFDFSRSFYPYDSYVTLLGSVDDGIYIGTERDLYFLQGTDPKDFIQIRKTGVAPLKNSMVKANSKDLGLEGSSNCILFATNTGLFGGFNGGEVVNFTEETIDIQDTYSFADAYIYDGKYIASFNK